MHNTDYYLKEISNMSNRFGDKLVKLMSKNEKIRLVDITFEEAKLFYDDLIKDT